MDVKRYSKIVCDYIDNLSDSEFDLILKESGIEKCPYEVILSDNKLTYSKGNLYSTKSYGKSMYSLELQVA